MKVKNFLSASILSIVFSACQGNENETKSIDGNDSVMNSIISNARKTKAKFLSALDSSGKDKSNYSVKIPFKTDDGCKDSHEHIWLNNIEKKDNVKFAGYVQNDPECVSYLKLGARVEFKIDEISDWMYIKNNKIYGGESTRYLISKIPETERSNEEKMILSLYK